MNEQSIIREIKNKYSIPEGSFPYQITQAQQRAAMITGRLLVHANKRGKRLKGRWV